MTSRPFYRSRLFWLGLPGLVFLLWGWWFSFGSVTGVEFESGRTWWVGQLAGDVVVIWNSEILPDWSQSAARHEQLPMEEAQRFKAQLVDASNQDATFYHVLIPHYAVVLIYAAGWLLTLAWWQRRKTRLMKLHTAP